MKLNTKVDKGEWYDYTATTSGTDVAASFRVRPFPYSFIEANTEDIVKELWNHFKYCLVDWKDVTDTNDKPLKCTDENKKAVFDYSEDVREFVFSKSREKLDEINKQLKNL